jgi:hypothetical protein
VATVAREQAIPTWDTRGSRLGEIAVGTLRYLRRNPELTIGLCLIFALLAFVAIGHFVVDLDKRARSPPGHWRRRHQACRSAATNRAAICSRS